MKENTILFGLNANKTITKEVSNILGMELGKVDILRFNDGEIITKIISPVRKKDVFVIQSTSAPANDHIIELLLFIDALKRADAHTVSVIIPYFGYSRQDRIASPGEPISAKMIANMLTSAGIDRVVSIDLHTSQIQGFFSCPVNDLSAIPLFAQYLSKFLENNSVKLSDVAVVSPDHGSINRARDLATLLPESQLVIVDKRRPKPNEVEITKLVGNVKDKVCIIIDDIVDTAQTSINSARELKNHGAKIVILAATHAVFDNKSLNDIFSSDISTLVVTNTIEKQIDSRVIYLSVSEMIADVVSKIMNNHIIDDYSVK